jgi:hypothetical protein
LKTDTSNHGASEHEPFVDHVALAGFSDEQWWSMCSAHMGLPQPLHEADLTKPFVYDRRWGVFFVSSGCHQQAMSVLLAFHNGLVKGIDVADRLGLDFSDGTAEYWLEKTPGAAFKSSVGKKVQAGPRGNLTAIERRWLGEIEHVF